MEREAVIRIFNGIINDAKRNYYQYEPTEIDELERWINGEPAALPFEDVCSEVNISCAALKAELMHKITTYRKVRGEVR